MHLRNPRARQAETGRSLELAGRQPTLLSELQPNEKPCLRRQGEPALHRACTLQTHENTHMRSYMYICRYTKDQVIVLSPLRYMLIEKYCLF